MRVNLGLVLAATVISTGCMEQYNIFPFWEKLRDEREMAHRKLPKLTKNGELPQEGGGEELMARADEAYKNYCANCHGVDGLAATMTAKASNPRPRVFADASWQDRVDDQRIYKVIDKGGMAVGLSPTMAPWGNVLDGEVIKALVTKVRSFKP